MKYLEEGEWCERQVHVAIHVQRPGICFLALAVFGPAKARKRDTKPS